VLLPIFDVYQSRDPQYRAEINSPVNSLRSGCFLTIDPLGRSSSRVGHTIYSPRPFAFSGVSLSPLLTMPRRRRDVMRFEINYSGGRRPRALEGAALFSGRPPVQFRSLARQERLPRCHHNAASIFVIDFLSEVPCDTSSARKCSHKKRKEGKKDHAVDCIEKTCAIVNFHDKWNTRTVSIHCFSYTHSARWHLFRGIIVVESRRAWKKYRELLNGNSEPN